MAFSHQTSGLVPMFNLISPLRDLCEVVVVGDDGHQKLRVRGHIAVVSGMVLRGTDLVYRNPENGARDFEIQIGDWLHFYAGSRYRYVMYAGVAGRSETIVQPGLAFGWTPHPETSDEMWVVPAPGCTGEHPCRVEAVYELHSPRIIARSA